ncbi:MAG TPA: ATP-binding protein [Candidatus Limnocylindrales bacterium]
MTSLFRARLAIVLAGIAVVGGMVALVNYRVDFGVRMEINGDRVMIASVADGSPARAEGLAAGMVVTNLNDTSLWAFPQYVYASPDANGNVPGQPIGIEPAVATPIQFDPGQLSALISRPIYAIGAAWPADLARMRADGGPNNAFSYVGFYQSALERSVWAYLAGALLLVVGAWWLMQGRAGRSLQPMAFPLATAIAMPLLVQPLLATWSPLALTVVGLLVPVSLGFLGLELAERVPLTPSGRFIRVAVVASATAAMAIGAFRPWLPIASAGADALWMALSAAASLIPGVAAAAPSVSTSPEGGSSGRLLQSAELAVAGATPGIALLTGNGSTNLFFPLSAWLLAVFAAGRLTVRPLARLAVRAQLQRDLVVAATEAERARVAADIHDDALQELTLLVQRLDTAGDTEGADIARTVSDRLRAICGDLRLPILDDLGVGPALDWLVSRIERISGGEVRLERSDGSRLPPQVELGIFRVAQEALANAVKHGRPPITVRYHATETGASLAVDDAGAGIEPDAASKAEAEGRFGLLNMQQRAEAIGAILDVRRWPAGGTHVALEWRAR